MTMYGRGAFALAVALLGWPSLAVAQAGTWSAVGGCTKPGRAAVVSALAAVPGNRFAVGGDFIHCTAVPVGNFAIFSTDAASWSGPSNRLDQSVQAVAAIGDQVFMGGNFTTAGGQPAESIVEWNATTGSWSGLGSGIGGSVTALAASGQDLYVGGNFTLAGGQPASNIARWNTATRSWSSLGTGVTAGVGALAVSGSDLYVGGGFQYAGGLLVNHVARWNLAGGGWSSLEPASVWASPASRYPPRLCMSAAISPQRAGSRPSALHAGTRRPAAGARWAPALPAAIAPRAPC